MEGQALTREFQGAQYGHNSITPIILPCSCSKISYFSAFHLSSNVSVLTLRNLLFAHQMSEFFNDYKQVKTLTIAQDNIFVFKKYIAKYCKYFLTRLWKLNISTGGNFSHNICKENIKVSSTTPCISFCKSLALPVHSNSFSLLACQHARVKRGITNREFIPSLLGETGFNSPW